MALCGVAAAGGPEVVEALAKEPAALAALRRAVKHCGGDGGGAGAADDAARALCAVALARWSRAAAADGDGGGADARAGEEAMAALCWAVLENGAAAGWAAGDPAALSALVGAVGLGRGTPAAAASAAKALGGLARRSAALASQLAQAPGLVTNLAGAIGAAAAAEAGGKDGGGNGGGGGGDDDGGGDGGGGGEQALAAAAARALRDVTGHAAAAGGDTESLQLVWDSPGALPAIVGAVGGRGAAAEHAAWTIGNLAFNKALAEALAADPATVPALAAAAASGGPASAPAARALRRVAASSVRAAFSVGAQPGVLTALVAAVGGARSPAEAAAAAAAAAHPRPPPSGPLGPAAAPPAASDAIALSDAAEHAAWALHAVASRGRDLARRVAGASPHALAALLAAAGARGAAAEPAAAALRAVTLEDEGIARRVARLPLALETLTGVVRAGGAAAEQAAWVIAHVTLEETARAQELQQLLVLAGPGGALPALPAAAGLLARELAADLVAIWGFAADNAPCAALLAVHGDCAGALSPSAAAHQGVGACACACTGACGCAAGQAASTLSDVVPQLQQAGLRGIEHALIGPASAPAGLLLVARRGPASEPVAGWAEVLLRTAACGMLQHVRAAEVRLVCNVLSQLQSAESPYAAVQAVLKGARGFLRQVDGLITTNPRIALLRGAGTQGSGAGAVCGMSSITAENAVLFELAPYPHFGSEASQWSESEADTRAGDGAGAAPLLMGLEQTLLAAAVGMRRPQVIEDTLLLMQGRPGTAARDVFGQCSRPVASIAVLPLLVAGRAPLGALYVPSERRCSFADALGPLQEFARVVAPQLERALQGHMGALEAGATQQASGWVDACGGGALARSCSNGSSISTDAATPTKAEAASACVFKHGSLARLDSGALLQALQEEVQVAVNRSLPGALPGAHKELSLAECIGRGGFGRVFRGKWQATPAAIKIMSANMDDSARSAAAMEMAVLSVVHHPNVVQLYSCLTDMVEVPAAPQAGCEAGPVPATAPSTSSCSSVMGAAAFSKVTYRRLLPIEAACGVEPSCNILVLEYCDRGSLRSAVRAGEFHNKQPSGAGSQRADVGAMVWALLDVARALQHLHAMHVLHGDVKLDNVLIKTEPSCPRGFVCKLADFGLAKVLSGGSATNRDCGGTLTHLAPEMFEPGSRITAAVDVYAFGVMMVELYTRSKWNSHWGMKRRAPGSEGVGACPVLPAGAPPEYARLSEDCCRAEPADRPALSEVVRRLEAALAAA
ncbi:Cyclic GMP-binding protein C [Monoraphidium neglectum]|uniref:Cyclic GMP-binding protein C n=1 Tax=Monoraphidium neglectum TaxID=145388 RepID=A0A0D2K4R2_9CHLO|nr:Cyclic GMP-binding protein C [Monoraphidium neglectum]KIZ05453.1 Cyclic GMP-binding protein C [Monoraphidium neglectum]|eukprot:XP_013904472.1 Cyclic GMP-binding protein C [Monoraphidium neglectum]